MFSNLGLECFSEILWKNGFSCYLSLMTLWVGGVCFLCGGKLKEEVEFRLCVLGLVVVSVVFFFVSDWFRLYFFFESSLLPIVLLILG